MLRAINAVSSGEAIFSPSIARRLINYFSTLEKTVSPLFPELTDREREVLTLTEPHQRSNRGRPGPQPQNGT